MLTLNTVFSKEESQVVAEILQRACEGKVLDREDLLSLMKCNPISVDASAIRLTADNLTRKAFGNAGEVHAQIGVNLATCSKGCKFCSFSRPVKRIEFSQEEVIARARAFQVWRRECNLSHGYGGLQVRALSRNGKGGQKGS